MRIDIGECLIQCLKCVYSNVKRFHIKLLLVHHLHTLIVVVFTFLVPVNRVHSQTRIARTTTVWASLCLQLQPAIVFMEMWWFWRIENGETINIGSKHAHAPHTNTSTHIDTNRATDSPRHKRVSSRGARCKNQITFSSYKLENSRKSFLLFLRVTWIIYNLSFTV